MNGDGSRSSTASARATNAPGAVVPHGLIHVVAGALIDAAGRVLLAQRPPGKHLAGYWEFPGGKVEPGESAYDALRRELREEIGVEVETGEPLIQVPWHYGTKSIFLDVYKIRAFHGEPMSGEGQALRWVPVDALDRREMPLADHPVVAALQLPSNYLITPEPGLDADAFLRRLDTALQRGVRLVQLRAKRLPPDALATLAREAHVRVRAAGGRLLLNAHIEFVRELGLDGVHLTSAQLASLDERPLPNGFWIGASCHNAAELAAAARLGADFAVLGPVFPTTSHAHEPPMGWEGFRGLIAGCPTPVYALGGLGPHDACRAAACGAQGVAGISQFW
jgi:8-oxo-dGTP diphosphatase